jgi:hypothetical protein
MNYGWTEANYGWTEMDYGGILGWKWAVGYETCQVFGNLAGWGGGWQLP